MKKYILVIDEEQLICSGMKRALNQERFQIDTAASVTEAICRHKASAYDVCLLDTRFDESCLPLLERVRKCWPGMKIILMTTCDISPHDNMYEYLQQVGENSVSRYLCKPFNLQQLNDAVAHALN
jgi:DNA-binding NtrC family response regulator